MKPSSIKTVPFSVALPLMVRDDFCKHAEAMGISPSKLAATWLAKAVEAMDKKAMEGLSDAEKRQRVIKAELKTLHIDKRNHMEALSKALTLQKSAVFRGDAKAVARHVAVCNAEAGARDECIRKIEALEQELLDMIQARHRAPLVIPQEPGSQD